MTRVVNLYHEPYDVYIGRPGKGQTGYFGNSHPIGWCATCKKRHDRNDSISEYKKDFDQRINTDAEFKKRVLELKDKTLGCFCKNKNPEIDVRCHGDVIKDFLDQL